MKLVKTFYILAVISISTVATLLVSTASAQNAGSIATKLPEDQQEKPSPFSLKTNLEYSSNLYRDNSVEAYRALQLAIIPSYVFSDQISMFGLTAITKEESGQKNTLLSNTQLGLSVKGFKLGEKTTTVHSLTGYLPTDAELRKTQRYQGTLRLGNGITTEALGTSLTYTFYVLRNFHEFNIAADGTPNVQYSLQHRVDISAPLMDKLTLDLTGVYRTGYTYRDFQRFSYLFKSTLGYEAAKNFVVFIGTSTDAAALKANGTESNIKAFDENKSYVRTGIEYVF